MKNVFVCDAGGFIVGYLVELLKDAGYWVRGVGVKMYEFVKSNLW